MTNSTSEETLTISELVRSPTLRAYLRNVRDWHGYIRFLGLPDRRDNPDILIDRLFVEPLVTRRYVSPDEDPSRWNDEAETIFDALSLRKPVILLGDPGTGKSTLLKYLAWLLARPTVNIWSKRMGAWLLPVPMVLRDLRLQGVKTFGRLLEAFLAHAMCEPLREGGYLKQMLEEGKVLILLDGIDEIGNRAARRNLHKAIFDGFARYPRCRWVLSSRIVGYDEVPFDREPELLYPQSMRNAPYVDSLQETPAWEEGKSVLRRDALPELKPRQMSENRSVMTRYIGPFDDARIEAFAQNWYVQREAAAVRAGDDAAHLVRAVHADDAILRLARVPNLLTMMALIHRVEATLPHGRALLYERIAEAYLESIDKFRGVYSGAYNLQQKRRWLARVGYEMQRRRSTDQGSRQEGGDAELLVESADVISWLNEEMKQGSIVEEMSAEEFLDFVGRRSGLFLPRGAGRYAFVHLSFQEYFAAVALEREVTGFNWAKGKPTQLGLTRDVVAKWARQSAWREPFAFVFELLAAKEDWHVDLLNAVFGEGYSRLDEDASDVHLAQLLARLVSNPRSGLAPEGALAATVAAVRPALRHQPGWQYPPRPPRVLAELLGDDSSWNAKVLAVVGTQLKQLKIGTLSLAQTQVSDLGELGSATALARLDLRQTQVSELGPVSNFAGLGVLNLASSQIADLGPLAKLSGLGFLDIGQTRVSDLGPLSSLSSLRYLYLGGTRIADVGALAKLEGLISLDVSGTRVEDLQVLANLKALKYLYLNDTRVADLGPLADLTALETLNCSGTRVADIGPLAKLTGLKSVLVWGTRVRDLRPLVDLVGLETLDLWKTEVVDAGPLADLAALTSLDLGLTGVSDVSALRNHMALRSLDLRQTEVAELGPLAGLRALRTLYLSGTPVSDLGSLICLTGLELLDLSHSAVVDLRPVGGLTALKSLDLTGTRVMDLKPLDRLVALESLVLRDTGVTSRMVAELREALPTCDIVD